MSLRPSIHKRSCFATLLSLCPWIKMQLDNDLPILFPNLRVFQRIPRHQPESEGIKASEYPRLQVVFVAACLWIRGDAFWGQGQMFRQKAAVCTCYLRPDVCQPPLARGQPKKQDGTVPCCLVQPHTSAAPPIPAGNLLTRLTQRSASSRGTSNQRGPL